MNALVPGFLTNLSAIFSGRSLLSGTLPAFLVLVYALIIVERVSGASVALWSESPGTTTVAALIGLFVLTILFENLNPLFSSWMTGDAPWIPQRAIARQLQRRQAAYAELTDLLDRTKVWDAAVEEAHADLDAAFNAAPAAAAPSPQVKAVIEWARAYVPTMDTASEVALLQAQVGAIQQSAAGQSEIQSAWDELAQTMDTVSARYQVSFGEKQGDFIARFPAREVVKPTRFGNRLAAIDRYALSRYGLSVSALWPRLRLVDAEKNKARWTATDDAKAAVDFLVACTWVHVGLATFGVIALPSLWFDKLLLVGVLAVGCFGTWASYTAAVEAVSRFGAQVTAAFDLSRWDLLAALHLPQPSNAQAEYEVWSRIGMYVNAEPPPRQLREKIWYR